MNAYSYSMFEMAYACLAPAHAMSNAARLMMTSPLNPMSYTPIGRRLAASAEMLERLTRRYAKPAFGIASTTVGGERIAIHERIVWERPFCRLIHFEPAAARPARNRPRLLIIAPMSGHYATLLRCTVETFLPTHEVYVTDWSNARLVPLFAGTFDLDDYIDYLIAILRELGPRTHAIGVCQPAVPLIAAVARMEAQDDPRAPASITLMGGPIDTRKNPTEVNLVAEQRGVEWFRHNCLVSVPFPYPGAGRRVYPGFLQLSGFMAMNFDRHVMAHFEMFRHLVAGDGDSAEKHRDFYDEYLAVMDLTAEFYMQTVDTVFVRHALPKGEMTHRGALVDLSCIRRAALMTVEGEKDDISGVGQTFAAHELCSSIPAARKAHHLQKEVGHYGVFNGSRFRAQIAPRICAFIATIDQMAGAERQLEVV